VGECTQNLEYRRKEGGQGWWQTKGVLAMPDMERQLKGGLVDLEQTCPRKNEELDSRLK
jgi:hypothetical protein